MLMSGWQFDSGVPLLRGRDAPAGAEVRFLKFLNGLCEAKPDLQIYILAWDFHVVFALEREWMQRVYFHWMTNSRFRFLFDDCPVPAARIIRNSSSSTARIAFLGGMDVCESRWDDRCHRGENPLRLSRGGPHKPYHDVQAYLAGADVSRRASGAVLGALACAGGGAPARFTPPADAPGPRCPRALLVSAPLASRSAGRSHAPRATAIREVESLFVDAIGAAERLVYVETQYFSSRQHPRGDCRAHARVGRRTARDRRRGERARRGLKEELAVGLRQAKNLERLREAATRTGHALGLYYSLCDGATEDVRDTYIHSKVLAVDDRFLTVGSANLTNRSMGIDSELHVSWEAGGVARDDRAPRARDPARSASACSRSTRGPPACGRSGACTPSAASSRAWTISAAVPARGFSRTVRRRPYRPPRWT